MPFGLFKLSPKTSDARRHGLVTNLAKMTACLSGQLTIERCPCRSNVRFPGIGRQRDKLADTFVMGDP